MPAWLSFLLEILKSIVPALVVFATVYYMMDTWFKHQYQLQVLKMKQEKKDVTIPLRLQAYERLTILCERLSIPNLLLRVRNKDQNCATLHMALIMTIQQEFEYNLSQQIYVSSPLWEIIKLSRDDTFAIVNAVAEKTDPKSPAEELARELLDYVRQQPVSSLEKAIEAVKKETSLVLAA
ncbi:MAG: hypothetical protein RI973_545 [Bacteroidota bacterium]|jgi:hypothetical protein